MKWHELSTKEKRTCICICVMLLLALLGIRLYYTFFSPSDTLTLYSLTGDPISVELKNRQGSSDPVSKHGRFTYRKGAAALWGQLTEQTAGLPGAEVTIEGGLFTLTLENERGSTDHYYVYQLDAETWVSSAMVVTLAGPERDRSFCLMLPHHLMSGGYSLQWQPGETCVLTGSREDFLQFYLETNLYEIQETDTGLLLTGYTPEAQWMAEQDSSAAAGLNIPFPVCLDFAKDDATVTYTWN